eukprot:scaffold2481_cov110-Cylindrotheca_fusiformis.AAC.1
MRSATTKQSQVTQHSSHGSTGGENESRSGSDRRSGSDANANGNAAPRHAYIPPSVGKREEANVLRARLLVTLILLLAVVGVATTTNLIVRQQERSDFENKFEGYATEILSVSGSKANQFFAALESFASSIGVQAAIEHSLRNTSWPFYRIPHWSVQAQKLAALTGADDPLLGMAPIVKEDEREEWNRFLAEQNPIWYQESIENEGYTKFTAKELVDRTVPFTYFIDSENDFQITQVTEPGETTPYFQAYPIGLRQGFPLMFTNIEPSVQSPNTRDVYRITKVTRRPTLGFDRIISDTHAIPASQIIQPIFDRANTKAEDREMVAVVLIQIPWLDYFNDLLAEGEDGIFVVLESACPKFLEDGSLSEGKNPTDSKRNVITYQVNGPDVVLLGEEDLHDPEYNDFVVSK